MNSTQKKSQVLLVMTTVAKKTDANKIAKTLLDQKMAACVSVLPAMESHYFWQDKICHDKEYLLLIKTLKSHYKKLEKILLEIHPYDCPEVLGIDSEKTSSAYAQWLKTATQTSF